ncbi:MAG: putative toxin-antitoxin system toxin component, PIN family, partial [Actinomycetota bacterium]|nr:putative toxin-antitoxin system toxin component, PIN family [Actinomycetota bacterium]
MIAVVLDTNTMVSGLGWSGAPSVLVDAVPAGELMLVSRPPLLDELERVLAYPKLVHVFNDPAGVTALVRSIADVVEPTSTLAAVADEPDNRVLEAAVEAGVDAVVTGDA